MFPLPERQYREFRTKNALKAHASLEAIALRFEAIASRLEAMAFRISIDHPFRRKLQILKSRKFFYFLSQSKQKRVAMVAKDLPALATWNHARPMLPTPHRSPRHRKQDFSNILRKGLSGKHFCWRHSWQSRRVSSNSMRTLQSPWQPQRRRGWSLCRFAPQSVLAPFVAMPRAPSSFLLLVVMPGVPSSVLAPSSDALCS